MTRCPRRARKVLESNRVDSTPNAARCPPASDAPPPSRARRSGERDPPAETRHDKRHRRAQVCMWSWDICADTCAICRNSLNEPSIEYQATRRRTTRTASRSPSAAAATSSIWTASSAGSKPEASAPSATRSGSSRRSSASRATARSGRPSSVLVGYNGLFSVICRRSGGAWMPVATGSFC